MPEELHPENELARLRTLWYFYLLSPVAYLIIALVIDYNVFKPNNQHGFIALSVQTYRLVLLALGAFGLATEPLILSLKAWYEKRISDALNDLPLFRKRLTMRTMVLAGICDIVAILGLLLFLLRGDIRTVFFFGILSLVYYAQAYPSKLRQRR
jgi:hypothetical protein